MGSSMPLPGAGVPRPTERPLSMAGIVAEGVTAGFLAAFAVALLFLVVDFIAGHPFDTPRKLGSLLMSGTISTVGVGATASPVALYTLFHFTAFSLAGVVVASVVHFTMKRPVALVLFVILFFAFEVVFTGFVAYLDVQSVSGLTPWQVATGNIIASLAMAAFFAAKYPRLRNIGTALSDDEE
jgi:hypothetical protein